jgi:hypothetical protein
MKRTKSKLRGAAMMEAVVLMPVLICVFFASIYIKRVYDHRLELQNEMHKNSAEFALSGCQGGGGGATGLITGCRGGPNLGLAEAARDKTGSVSAKAGMADSQGAQTAFNTQNIKAHSSRLCNEIPREGDLVGMVQTTASMLWDPRVGPSGDPTQGQGCGP